MKLQSDWAPLEEIVPAEIFRAEVRAWARRLGVEPKEIRLRPMKRKWGSCSTSSRLTFNVELLRQPADVRRRVIVEELLQSPQPRQTLPCPAEGLSGEGRIGRYRDAGIPQSKFPIG